MKLARIILPEVGNDYTTLWHQHQELKDILLGTWGGYTSWSANGAYRMANGMVATERVVIYEIAMSLGDVLKLRKTAQEIGAKMKQECVLIITPCGDAEFVKITEKRRLTPLGSKV